MEKKLTNNLGLKIISVFLAFFVWLAVVNISNPKVPDSREVPLEILNGDVLEASGKTYELLNDRSTVTVSYQVRTMDAVSIKSTDFRAYIDLAEMYEPTGSVQVKVEVKNNKNLLLESVTAKPAVIRVDTEDLQRKPFDLTVYLEGTPEEDYKEGVASISPTYVYVNGPMSAVGQISKVGIILNMDGADSNLTGKAPVKCFDANDNELRLDDRVTFSRTEIDYTLPILKIKNLGLNLETEGTVAEGYRFTGIESNRNSVAVKGLKSALAGVNSITIPKAELNMDGATSDREVTLDLSQYLPEGVQLADSSANEIKVVIKVEALESRAYELPVSRIKMISASDQYDYEYNKETVKVLIRGLKDDLDQLAVENLEAEMDVSGMEPGIRTGALTLPLEAAYELVSVENPQLTISAKEPSAEASASESEEGPGAQTESSGESTEETTESGSAG